MAKRPKYGNRKVTFKGETFDSARERDRYIYLLEQEGRGNIMYLRRQVAYELVPEITESVEVQLKTKTKTVVKVVQRAVTYRCDFEYVRCSDGATIVEDVKICPALIPKEYVIKEKLFRWRFGFPIRRVYSATEGVEDTDGNKGNKDDKETEIKGKESAFDPKTARARAKV